MEFPDYPTQAICVQCNTIVAYVLPHVRPNDRIRSADVIRPDGRVPLSKEPVCLRCKTSKLFLLFDRATGRRLRDILQERKENELAGVPAEAETDRSEEQRSAPQKEDAPVLEVRGGLVDGCVHTDLSSVQGEEPERGELGKHGSGIRREADDTPPHGHVKRYVKDPRTPEQVKADEEVLERFNKGDFLAVDPVKERTASDYVKLMRFAKFKDCRTCENKRLFEKDVPTLSRRGLDGEDTSTPILCDSYLCGVRPGKDAYENPRETTSLWISEDGDVWEEAQTTIENCEYWVPISFGSFRP